MLYFSGGTALNSYVDALCQSQTPVTFVLPISDDGGSTGEILRALGGSRLVRLAERTGPEAEAVQKLLLYRLPPVRADALASWQGILAGDDPLWSGITEPYKESIRAFLLLFNQEVLRRAPKNFDWSGGSVGNFFFTGARLFFNSLEAAIFLFSRVARIPPHIHVLPALGCTNKVLLGARLRNGERIIGQNNISHPGKSTQVHKESQQTLGSPIESVFYLTEEGQQVHHQAADAVLSALSSVQVIVYAMGSLFTSIMPCLVLKGVGERIASHTGKKVLLLNAKPDRETFGRTASEFVTAITDGLNRVHTPFSLGHVAKHYVTHVVAVEGSLVPVDAPALHQLGIECRTLAGEQDASLGCTVFPKAALADFMLSLHPHKHAPTDPRA